MRLPGRALIQALDKPSRNDSECWVHEGLESVDPVPTGSALIRGEVPSCGKNALQISQEGKWKNTMVANAPQ
jgi:hypothetical protein